MNEELEPICRQEWELSTSMARMRLRGNMPGHEPAWNWNRMNGCLEWNSKGGIDWWWYNKVSFLPNPIEYSTNLLFLLGGPSSETDSLCQRMHG